MLGLGSSLPLAARLALHDFTEGNFGAFGVYRLDDRVRLRRQEDVDVVRTGDQLRLRATVAAKFSPDVGRRNFP